MKLSEFIRVLTKTQEGYAEELCVYVLYLDELDKYRYSDEINFAVSEGSSIQLRGVVSDDEMDKRYKQDLKKNLCGGGS